MSSRNQRLILGTSSFEPPSEVSTRSVWRVHEALPVTLSLHSDRRYTFEYIGKVEANQPRPSKSTAISNGENRCISGSERCRPVTGPDETAQFCRFEGSTFGHSLASEPMRVECPRHMVGVDQAERERRAFKAPLRAARILSDVPGAYLVTNVDWVLTTSSFPILEQSRVAELGPGSMMSAIVFKVWCIVRREPAASLSRVQAGYDGWGTGTGSDEREETAVGRRPESAFRISENACSHRLGTTSSGTE